MSTRYIDCMAEDDCYPPRYPARPLLEAMADAMTEDEIRALVDWNLDRARPRRRPYRAALIVAGAALAIVSIVAGTLTALGG